MVVVNIQSWICEYVSYPSGFRPFVNTGCRFTEQNKNTKWNSLPSSLLPHSSESHSSVSHSESIPFGKGLPELAKGLSKKSKCLDGQTVISLELTIPKYFKQMIAKTWTALGIGINIILPSGSLQYYFWKMRH